MIKNLTTNQLLLIALATLLLLLAAFSFYLLENPSAPLPFSALPPTPSPTSNTSSSVNASPTTIPPTRQTSYTPRAAFVTPGLTVTKIPAMTAATMLPMPTSSPQPISSQPYPPAITTTSSGPIPATVTPTGSRTPPVQVTATGTPATATSTFAPGEVGVMGRVIQNGTPLPGVVLNFADDATPRQTTTGPGGHYTFVTLAPGTAFTITFNQAENPNLTPPAEITSYTLIEGTLPIGVNPILIPDLEISIDLNSMLFSLLTPVDGATYSASAIRASNPLQFTWLLYSGGGSYHIELYPNGSDQPIWSSGLLSSTSYMWDGTLDNGNHITQGTYWWRVSVTRSLANYVEVIYTQPFDLFFNP